MSSKFKGVTALSEPAKEYRIPASVLVRINALQAMARQAEKDLESAKEKVMIAAGTAVEMLGLDPMLPHHTNLDTGIITPFDPLKATPLPTPLRAEPDAQTG